MDLAAVPHAERAVERARAERDEHGGADQAEGEPDGIDGQQGRRAGRARGGVEGVDERDAGADGQPHAPAAAQGRAHKEQRHRSQALQNADKILFPSPHPPGAQQDSRQSEQSAEHAI